MGTTPNKDLEVNVGERITLEKENSVAVKGRGVFKIKRHVDDVDVAIREGSLKTVTREKRRIPRR